MTDYRDISENEYKILLDGPSFYAFIKRVEELFPTVPRKDAVQVNYYYDTDDGLLRSQDITLRVRLTEAGLWLQSKVHCPERTAYRHSEERCCVLSSLPRQLRLAGFPGRCFELQGSLTTRRTRFRLPDGLRLDFDVNFYEGRTDYELELEFFPEAHERARLLLQELGIPEKAAGDVGDGKATRFFTAREGRPKSSVTADLGFSGRIDGKAKKGIEDKIGRKEAVGHG